MLVPCPDAWFRSLAETTSDCCAIYAPVRGVDGAVRDFRLEYVNEHAREFHQIIGEHEIGSSLVASIPAYVVAGVFSAFSRVVHSGQPLGRQVFAIDKLGADRPRCVIALSASRSGDNVVACWRDVTSTIELASDALQPMSAEHRHEVEELLTQSAEGIVVVDDGGHVRFANQAARSLLRTAEDLVGLQLGSPAIREPVELVVPVGEDPSVLEMRACRIAWEGESASLAVFRDITQKKRSEDALRDSERRFRHLFDNSADAIMIADRDGRCVDVNGAACQLFGRSRKELLATRVGDLVTPGGSPPAGAEYAAYVVDGYRSGTFSFVRADGAQRTCEYSAFPLSSNRFASITRDVTERRSLEEQLRQSQKMEAVGRLAGGIAHDFNNMLTAIISFAGFVKDETPEGDPRREDVSEILGAAERAAALTRQLLAFSRRQHSEPTEVDLNALVHSAHRLFRRTLGEDIEIVMDLGDDLATVWVDSGQFEQVVMNLALNARDAMPEGGKLMIETANEPGKSADHDSVVLRVRDTGHGMDEEVRARVFEPFFTTKEKGKGTGLGLATVYGLVTQAGGAIDVDSEVGSGTCFQIRLPASGDCPEPGSLATGATQRGPAAARGPGRGARRRSA